VKLQRIAVPVWSPPEVGPWRIRWTRSTGASDLGVISYTFRSDAEHDAAWGNRIDGASVSHVVVPDPGGARWAFP
jgi:hypothetical protein